MHAAADCLSRVQERSKEYAAANGTKDDAECELPDLRFGFEAYRLANGVAKEHWRPNGEGVADEHWNDRDPELDLMGLAAPRWAGGVVPTRPPTPLWRGPPPPPL